MTKQAPSAGRIFTMLAFAGSCVGLLIFLWISFGGATPFAGRGYRLVAEFNQATALATQSDVRISGVSVGKVISVGLDRQTGRNRAVIELQSRFAPRPADTQAILRAKTLLGETYIELTPGSRTGATIPDGGSIPQTRVAPTVQLDEILSTFDPATREAFRVWQQQDAIALTNRGENLNAALAELYPFASNVDAVLTVLRRQGAATRTFLRDTGVVFSSLAASPAQLQGFIRNANATFAATAAQANSLAATIQAFPAFLRQTRSTLNRLTTFSQNADPLINELKPAADQLSPALQQTVILAPELRDLLVNVAPLTQASAAGVPAVARFFRAITPWLQRAKPYLGGLIPIINYINTYRREVAGFFANSTATTQGKIVNAAGTRSIHYLRLSNPINPEILTQYSGRLGSNRGAPYMAPGGYSQLTNGLSVFGGYLCTSRPQPTIGSSIPPDLASVLSNNYYTARPGGPPCKAQGALGPQTTGQNQTFPHLTALP
jgi:phospholipid/cholesterol/gamma-HCH transport system substrate-binding protein